MYFVSCLRLKKQNNVNGLNNNECVKSSWRSRVSGLKELFDILQIIFSIRIVEVFKQLSQSTLGCITV